jgi:hypothetical protein
MDCSVHSKNAWIIVIKKALHKNVLGSNYATDVETYQMPTFIEQ